jgi:hypothetical protein
VAVFFPLFYPFPYGPASPISWNSPQVAELELEPWDGGGSGDEQLDEEDGDHGGEEGGMGGGRRRGRGLGNQPIIGKLYLSS